MNNAGRISLSLGFVLFAACAGANNTNTTGTNGSTGSTGSTGPMGNTGLSGMTETPVPTALIGLSAGYTSTCAVLATKAAKCWGRNNEGQLGNGNTTNSVKPVAVSGLTTVKQISVGYEHACAVLDDGTVRCWGSNANGQLGDSSKNDSLTPVTVTGLGSIATVHAGVSMSCALTTGGDVTCWGRGGDIGDGGVSESLVPKTVAGLSNVKQLSVAPDGGTTTRNHVCGVRLNGTAFCWGGNEDGQLGDGTQNSQRAPIGVTGVTDALEITAGGVHACARRSSGLYCWGFSQAVGDGTVERRFVPTAVSGNPTVTAVAAGDLFTLAVTSTNLICWGKNGRGACGDGAAFPSSGPVYLTPVASSVTKATILSAGSYHACAYNGDTQVTYCWGGNDYGEIGFELEDDFITRTSVPSFVRW